VWGLAPLRLPTGRQAPQLTKGWCGGWPPKESSNVQTERRREDNGN